MNKEINDFINSLKYDLSQVQATQTEEGEKAESLVGSVDELDGLQTNVKTTEKIKVNSKGRKVVVKTENVKIDASTEEFDILNDMPNSCYPGALISIDKKVFEGMPTPFKADPNSITISTDLPNSTSLTVENPNSIKVNHAIDQIVQTWMDEQQSKGYEAKSNISYKQSEYHDINQVSADLGVNVNVLPASFTSSVKGASEVDTKIDFVMFKQTLFTVNAAPNSNVDHSSFFKEGTDFETIKEACKDGKIPGYVDSVEYGRTVLLKIESSRNKKDIKGSLNLDILNQGGFKADLHAAEIFSSSKISAVMIGGNNTQNAQVFDIKSPHELTEIIKGTGSSLSKNSPAAAVSYKIRDIKNKELLPLNLTTQYTKRTITPLNSNTLKFSNRGAYTLDAKITYKEEGVTKNKNISVSTQGKKILELGETAQDIKVSLNANLGITGTFRDMNVYKDIVGDTKIRTTGTLLTAKSKLYEMKKELKSDKNDKARKMKM